MNDQNFIFEIPNTKRKMYQLFAYGIFILNAVIALLYTYFKSSSTSFYILLATIIVIVLLLVMTLKNADQKIKNVVTTFMFVFGILIWLKTGFYWAALINATLLLLHKNAVKTLLITISKENVIYPSFPKKVMDWSQIQHIILKDGLLTIDQKNNKIIQHEVIYDETKIIEEQFNSFCLKNLH